MNTMSMLTLAVTATAALGAAATSTAYAGRNLNGPRLTGSALESLESHRPVVSAVGLPSGDTVEPDMDKVYG
jgi:hypothetical protein